MCEQRSTRLERCTISGDADVMKHRQYTGHI